jgi:outer membrane protein assembly factor BamB
LRALIASSLLFVLLVELTPLTAVAQWPQFGGPRRDFTCDPVELKLAWPADGPKRVWSRPFGDGYSGIVVDNERLFSMYREGDDEIIACLEVENGKTIWQYRYTDPIDKAQFASRYGYGPRSTPLIVGTRLFAVSFNGRLSCVEMGSGILTWSVDLVNEFKAQLPRWGYANSPIDYGDTIILPVGSSGAAFVAFDQVSGRTVWRRHDFENSYGSPILIEVDGQPQLVCLMAKEVVGLDPKNGSLLWQHPHEGQWRNNVPNPVWGLDQSLLVSSEGNAGTRLLKLTQSNGKTEVKEKWAVQKFRVVHRNLIRIGNRAYGSSGDFGPSLFSAIDIESGDIAWQTRDIGRAGLLRVGERLLMLEESGHLLLATPDEKGITVHARAKLLDEQAWTIPTLVGKRLYLRDRAKIMAVELP